MSAEATEGAGVRRNVFISYAQRDKPTAQLLALRLQDVGISVWLDTELQPGELWQDIVDSKLGTSDYFVALLSSASLSSQHFREEVLKIDFLRGLSDRSIPIIPILIDDVAVPFSMQDMLYLDFRADPRLAVEQLVKTLAPAINVDFAALLPNQFEHLVSDLLSSRVSAIERDVIFQGQVFDLRLSVTYTDPFGSSITEDWLVEVKHYSSSRLSVSVMQQFAALATSMSRHNMRLALVTSSQVTSAARGLARKSPLRLVEGVELKRALISRPELVREYFGSGRA